VFLPLLCIYRSNVRLFVNPQGQPLCLPNVGAQNLVPNYVGAQDFVPKIRAPKVFGARQEGGLTNGNIKNR
jgi:hypothetical protein